MRTKKECIAMLLAGGQGSRLEYSHKKGGQAGHSIRRKVPHH